VVGSARVSNLVRDGGLVQRHGPERVGEGPQHPVHGFHAGLGGSCPIGCMSPGWIGSGARGGADACPTC
jgi:hypothetical protein